MATYKIYYNSYPGCPKATKYSKRRASNAFTLGLILNIGSLVVLYGFIMVTIELFASQIWLEFLLTTLILYVFAYLSFRFYVVRDMKTDRKCKLIVARELYGINDYDINRLNEELYTIERNEISRVRKKYYLFFIGGKLDIIGIIGFVSGVYYTIHGNIRWILIILSFIGVILISVIVWYIYFREFGSLPPLMNKSSNDVAANTISDHLHENRLYTKTRYCRECGTKLMAGSVFCSKCGTKIL